MPHFSKSNHQFKFGLSGDKNYRLTAWINFQTPWNDATNRYDPMTEEQRAHNVKSCFDSSRHQVVRSLSRSQSALTMSRARVSQIGKLCLLLDA